MDPKRDEREVRAARNQSLFRQVNAQLQALNEAFSSLTDLLVLACECANTSCIEQLEIRPEDYERVRANPRQFVILPGHVLADVENVVATCDAYLVVEKTAQAGEVAEVLA